MPSGTVQNMTLGDQRTMLDLYFGRTITANPTNRIDLYRGTLEVSLFGWLLVISRRINHEDQQ